MEHLSRGLGTALKRYEASRASRRHLMVDCLTRWEKSGGWFFSHTGPDLADSYVALLWKPKSRDDTDWCGGGWQVPVWGNGQRSAWAGFGLD